MLCVMQDGWPACDFNEYIYGPRSHWPTEEEVREFVLSTNYCTSLRVICLVLFLTLVVAVLFRLDFFFFLHLH